MKIRKNTYVTLLYGALPTVRWGSFLVAEHFEQMEDIAFHSWLIFCPLLL